MAGKTSGKKTNKKKYNKLVRDRIPQLIRAAGNECSVKTIVEVEYAQALWQKLIEEAKEAAKLGCVQYSLL